MQVFDMTRAEVGLVIFIFALVYSAGFLPKLVSRLTRAGARRDEGGSDADD